MAGTLMATVPLILVFLLGARQFIANLAAGAIKA
jgi:cellobiose transport system permease protein